MRTIHELTAAFAKGDASPVKVAEEYLARIDALDAKVGAYLTVTRDEALAAARGSEARYRASAIGAERLTAPGKSTVREHAGG